MESSTRHSQSRPWQPGSPRNAPILSFGSLVASLMTSGLALFVVRFADGKPVDSWPIAPSVYLSILATLSSMILRWAFQTGAETHWWALLLSDSGVDLHTLHVVWELSHDSIARFKFQPHDLQPTLRAAGILLIFLAGNGPLLQRAVSISLVQTTTPFEMELPVRREPMWNLTTKVVDNSRHVWSPPPYQDEFAEIVTELNQRRPIELRSASCPLDSTCTTIVTVASFSRICTKEYVPVKGAPTLAEFEMIVLKEHVHQCRETRIDPEDSGELPLSYCRWLNLNYQLAVTNLRRSSSPGPELEELPWLSAAMPPNTMNYTSYFKEDAASDMLAVQRCNFTSAFVDIPIEITEERIVKMKPVGGTELARLNKGIQSIPAAAGAGSLFDALIGIQQAMSDLYGGYVFFDHSEGSHTIRGTGPRQSINQTSITTRPKGEDDTVNGGYSVSFLDPLANFTETLHELSLRYAVKTMPSTRQRLEEMDDYLNIFMTNGGNDPRPGMEEAVRLMKTKPSPRQRVAAQQTKLVAVYRVDILFAAVAVGITSSATLFVGFLYTGWKRLGRRFSMSPVEIAKAFDSPLLFGVGSNMPGHQIAKSHGNLRLRYGERDEKQPFSVKPGAVTGNRLVKASDVRVDADMGADANFRSFRTRLTVGVSEQISTPVKGRTYV